MKRYLVLLLFIPSLGLAQLSNHGPYLGGQIGHVDTHTGKFGTDWSSYRIFGGWRFNDNFALEGGYNSLTPNDDNKNYGGDIVGKAIVPLALDFSLYIKAGGEYVYQDADNKKDGTVLPVMGIGAGFNLTKGLNIDASWTYAWGHSGISNIDYAALGLSYTF